MVNIMRSCVCGDVVDKMKNDFSVILFASLSVGPCPPKVLQYESWSTPIWHLRPHPKNDTPKKTSISLRKTMKKKLPSWPRKGAWGDASWSLKRLAGIFQKCSNEAQVGPTMVPPGGLFSQPRVGLGSPFGDRPGPAPNQHSQKKRCFTEENLSFLLACQLSRAPRGIPNA